MAELAPVRPLPVLALLLACGIVCFNAAWVAARLGVLHKPKRVLESDHRHYIEMARGAAGQPELARRAPYCWRVVVPGLVRLSLRAGLDLHLAFYLLTNLALIGLLVVLDAWLADLGFAPWLRVVGLLLVGLMQGAVRWFEYQYWMTDPQGLLLVAAGVLLAWHARWRSLAALSLLSAGVRETHVLVYPFVLALVWRQAGLRAAGRRTLLVAGPALMLTAALRLGIEPLVHPTLGASIADNLAFRWHHLTDNQPYVLSIGTWGVLLPLALLGSVRGRVWHRWPEQAVLLLAVYATTILISNNNERPLAYALPAVLPAALVGLSRLAESGRLACALWVTAALAVQVLFYLETRFTGLGISIYQPVSWPVVLVCALFAGVGWRVLRPATGA